MGTGTSETQLQCASSILIVFFQMLALTEDFTDLGIKGHPGAEGSKGSLY